MSAADDVEEDKKVEPQDLDIEKYLAEKEKMDALFREKFEKILTVMFTDLVGSTSMTETVGDLASRMVLKHHNDIVFPIIKNNKGVLVKTIGDGTLSYFDRAQDGVRAATQIQKALDDFNLSKELTTPIIVRIGLHTGQCGIDKNDIGDTVNTASRYESAANGGEVYISEETYNALRDKAEIYCRFIKQATLKGKKEPVNIYKAFWNHEEIEHDIKAAEEPQEAAEKKKLPRLLKLALVVIIPILTIFIFIQTSNWYNKWVNKEAKRTIHQSASDSNDPEDDFDEIPDEREALKSQAVK